MVFALPQDIYVTVDRNKVNFPDAVPFIDTNNRTLIPVRFVSVELGAKVEWNADRKEVNIEKESVKVRINDRNIVINGSTIKSMDTKAIIKEIEVNNTIKTMDTNAIISEARTYVPIRYIAEALGAKVGWNGSTKTVIITTGEDKSYVDDFYKINPDMPEEWYTYEYKLEPIKKNYQTNKYLIENFGLVQTQHEMQLAKDYMEASYNLDYRTLNKDEYVKKIKWYFMSEMNWYGGDNVERIVLEYLADVVSRKQIIMRIQYITDPSLVVGNGNALVRGRAVYTIESCNDMNWINEFFPFGESELGKEHIRGMDVEIINMEQKKGWEHSPEVVYSENILSIIK